MGRNEMDAGRREFQRGHGRNALFIQGFGHKGPIFYASPTRLRTRCGTSPKGARAWPVLNAGWRVYSEVTRAGSRRSESEGCGEGG